MCLWAAEWLHAAGRCGACLRRSLLASARQCSARGWMGSARPDVSAPEESHAASDASTQRTTWRTTPVALVSWRFGTTRLGLVDPGDSERRTTAGLLWEKGCGAARLHAQQSSHYAESFRRGERTGDCLSCVSGHRSRRQRATRRISPHGKTRPLRRMNFAISRHLVDISESRQTMESEILPPPRFAEQRCVFWQSFCDRRLGIGTPMLGPSSFRSRRVWTNFGRYHAGEPPPCRPHASAQRRPRAARAVRSPEMGVVPQRARTLDEHWSRSGSRSLGEEADSGGRESRPGAERPASSASLQRLRGPRQGHPSLECPALLPQLRGAPALQPSGRRPHASSRRPMEHSERRPASARRV